jgi:cytochrome c oxidase subunit 4
VANTHHHDDHDHGIAHVAPVKVLLGTWGALMVLTVVTVLATKIDFGSSLNLAIAMAIAVVKATLVILFFMHLAYDKLFHSVMVGGGLLAAGLFIAISLMDSDQYQQNLIWNPEAPPAAPYGPRPLPQ